METKVNLFAPASVIAANARGEGVVVVGGGAGITAAVKGSEAKGELCAHGASALLVLGPQPNSDARSEGKTQ